MHEQEHLSINFHQRRFDLSFFIPSPHASKYDSYKHSVIYFEYYCWKLKLTQKQRKRCN